MSELHCPSCGHLVGILRGTDDQDGQNGHTAVDMDLPAVSEWLHNDHWDGELRPLALFERFSSYRESKNLPRLEMTQRRMSSAMIRLGVKWRKTRDGRAYYR